MKELPIFLKIDSYGIIFNLCSGARDDISISSAATADIAQGYEASIAAAGSCDKGVVNRHTLKCNSSYHGGWQDSLCGRFWS